MPALLAGAAVGAVTLTALLIRVSRSYPVNPWEPSLMVEAFRLLHGMPIYTDVEQDHATAMFGPLSIAWMGLAALLGGQNFWAMRTVSVASILVLSVLGVWVFGRGLPTAVRIVCAGLLIGLSFPMDSHFADPKPDAVALCTSFLGLLLLARGQETSRLGAWLIGLTLLLAAAFTKQTSAMFAAIPCVALLVRFRVPTLRDTILAIAPLVVVGLSLLVVRVAIPHVAFYMFIVPSGFGIRPDLIWPMALKWSAMASLSFLGLAAICLKRPAAPSLDVRARWLLASLAVTTPVAILSAAQNSGEAHRLLPSLLPALLLAIYGLSLSIDFWNDPRIALAKRLSASILIAILICTTYFRDFGASWYWATKSRFGDENYLRVVAATSTLAGRVLSPNDPTIVLRAKGQPGRSMVAEWDAINWRHPLPKYLDDYLRTGDWIVLVDNTEFRDGVNRDKLQSIGFVQVTPWEIQSDVYSLWRRSDPWTPGESSMSVNNRAVDLMAKAKYDEAEPLFKHALFLDPKNDLAQTNLGVLKAAMGDLVGSATAHELAVQMAPQSPSPPYWRGRFFASQRQWGRAIADFQVASDRRGAGLRESAALIESLLRAGLKPEADLLIAKLSGAALERERDAFSKAFPTPPPPATPPAGSTPPAR